MKTVLMATGLCLLATAVLADSGRDLVRICTQSASLCSSDFQSDEIVAALKANTCVPPAPGAAQQPIVDWLAKHPRTARRDIGKAVTAATSALWPCRK